MHTAEDQLSLETDATTDDAADAFTVAMKEKQIQYDNLEPQLGPQGARRRLGIPEPPGVSEQPMPGPDTIISPVEQPVDVSADDGTERFDEDQPLVSSDEFQEPVIPNEPSVVEIKAPSVELSKRSELLLKALAHYANFDNSIEVNYDELKSGNAAFLEAEGIDQLPEYTTDPTMTKYDAMERSRQFRDKYVSKKGDFAPELSDKARADFEQQLQNHLKLSDNKT